MTRAVRLARGCAPRLRCSLSLPQLARLSPLHCTVEGSGTRSVVDDTLIKCLELIKTGGALLGSPRPKTLGANINVCWETTCLKIFKLGVPPQTGPFIEKKGTLWIGTCKWGLSVNFMCTSEISSCISNRECATLLQLGLSYFDHHLKQL